MSETARTFNVGHDSTVSAFIRILKLEIVRDTGLQDVINILTQELPN